MRKQRRQPAFASLTDAEIEQIALWLDGETYAAVRLRVNKPRSEGGFGLNISERPLERLWKRKKTIDKINTHITKGEKLTLATFDAITAGDSGPCGEHPACEEVHDAILFETMEAVRVGDNTPTQLLALQRLADFPARADYRHHKIEMDLHRKQVATERLALAQRAQAFQEKKHEDRQKRLLSLPTGPSNLAPRTSNILPDSDELGPIPTDPRDLEAIRARARKAFDITPEESARRAELRRTWKNPNAALTDGRDAFHSVPNSQSNAGPIDKEKESSPLNLITLLKDLASPSSPITNAKCSILDAQRDSPADSGAQDEPIQNSELKIQN